MALSTVQRVALASGLVLAVSLLLPKAFLSRGKQPPQPHPAPEGKLGRFPPVMHHHSAPSTGQTPGSRFQRSHLAEAFAKARGSGGGTGGANFELAQLQEKLKETEEAMEKLINRVGPNGERAQIVTSDQEKRLLHQLREITRVMKEGKLIDRPTPEKEAEEAPYMEDWEGYPEETYPIYDPSDCMKHRQETILVDYPDLKEPSAEEIAERMEELGEEESGRLSWENMPTDPRAQGGNSVTLHAPKPETCSCCFHEDEDPVVLAENAAFGADSFSEQEEATKEDWSQDFADEGVGNRADQTHTGGMLRKRNPQGLE